MGERMTGGCQCGRVRYAATVDRPAGLCHCRMCQRATGGVFAALQAVSPDALEWLGALPDYHRSSPIARRGFCAACGTPLTFEFVEDATEIELTVGSFDEPWRLAPERQFGVEGTLAAWTDVAGLPGVTCAENPNVADRWRRAADRGA